MIGAKDTVRPNPHAVLENLEEGVAMFFVPSTRFQTELTRQMFPRQVVAEFSHRVGCAAVYRQTENKTRKAKKKRNKHANKKFKMIR